MKFTETEIPGAWLIELDRIEDDRGFFARAWSEDELRDHGIDPTVVQINLSRSRHRGTIRGMHYQRSPHAEGKFVRCIRGALFDVLIDLRPDSPGFLRWAGYRLSADQHQALYVPPGCAHGFQTLEDDTEAFYMVSAPYCASAEGGIRWNDPRFGIEWPLADHPVLSDKDRGWPDHVVEPAAVANEETPP